eukprot:GHVT01033261.1.p1 GENE.GHVT01033261.1~~GHVT01033261.1.p1  ORF type:complete len:184 (+),score=48.56 GHVT01033261.1:423-974(+)
MPDESFKQVSLEDYKGKYVFLFFYPLDFTFVCPSEILSIDKAIKEFTKRDVQVLGCSIDSVHVHAAWRRTAVADGGIGPVGFPLLSDLKRAAAEAFDVLDHSGVSLRGWFLMDRAGLVQHAMVNNLALGRSVAEALRVVAALQHSESHGEVCPAEWQEGEAAMDPTRHGVADYLKSNFGNSQR